MKYPDNIREVAKFSPDFMGFIFYQQSKRFVGDDFVMPEISPGIAKVGVFVNDALERILEKAAKYKLDYVQLHGGESPEFCKKVGNKVKVIKAFGLPCYSERNEESFLFDSLAEYENCCEYFLFDTRTSEHGGSGKSFDRNILRNYQLSKPFFLSGGIDEADVADLCIQTSVTKPFAIDVNSKFEIEPGLKDIDKLKILIHELSGK